MNLSAAEASNTNNVLQLSAPTCQAVLQIYFHLSQPLQHLMFRARRSPFVDRRSSNRYHRRKLHIATSLSLAVALHRTSQIQYHDQIPEFQLLAPTSMMVRICATAILCNNDHCAAVPLAAMTDRACDTTTTCIVLLTTATINRICPNVTDCAVDSSISVPATANSNNICMKLSVCPSKEFEHMPPTATSNRICPHTRPPCNNGTEYQVTTTTPNSDRVRILFAGRLVMVLVVTNMPRVLLITYMLLMLRPAISIRIARSVRMITVCGTHT